MQRMRRLRAGISQHDSAARFRDLGIDVFLAAARFTGPDTVEAGGETLSFTRAVIATGTRPAVLNLPGLAEVGYLSNESIFDLTELPRRLVVVGGGPIGCELGQAFRRFGSEVHLINRGDRLLAREEPDAPPCCEAGWSAREFICISAFGRCVRSVSTGNVLRHRGRG